MSQPNTLFFSIVIPAHNEELYIAETLKHIANLDYPRGYYEAIVIENGSSDKTYATAKQFETSVIKVLTTDRKGVSIAKNIGIEKRSPESDWAIFLDADTILKQNFLRDLNVFLVVRKSKNFTVGTTQILPMPDSFKARAWFSFYNQVHHYAHVSYAIQLFKSSVLGHERFDEKLAMGEDSKLIRDAKKHGKFFYFATREVFTSTRRFEQHGWWSIFFYWWFVSILPVKLQSKFGYTVTR